MQPEFKLVSRDSFLAIAQTLHTAGVLLEAGSKVTIQTMKTSGDIQLSDPLYLSALQGDKEGKAFFTKELETALLNNQADLAVHSLKDVPTQLPHPLRLTHFFSCLDDSDILVSASPLGVTTSEISLALSGKKLGSSSMRRLSAFSLVFPKSDFVNVRGNVQTRLRKLLSPENQLSAIILAAAGLKRFFAFFAEWNSKRHFWQKYLSETLFQKIEEDINHITDLVQRKWYFYKVKADFLLPASGQGILGLEAGALTAEQFSVLDMQFTEDTKRSRDEIICEREILSVLGAGCHAPLGLRVSKAGHLKINFKNLKKRYYQVEYFYEPKFHPQEKTDRLPRYGKRFFEEGQIHKLSREIAEGNFPIVSTGIEMIAGEADFHIPLTKIRTLDSVAIPDSYFPYVVITSPRCVSILQKYSLQPQCIMVPGKSTQQVVQKAYPNAKIMVAPNGNGYSAAESLFQEMNSLNTGVLWAGAREGNKAGVVYLRNQGVHVTEVELYEHLENDPDIVLKSYQTFLQPHGDKECWWMFTSSLAASMYLKNGFLRDSHFISCIGMSTAAIFLEKNIIPHHIASTPEKELQFAEIRGKVNTENFEIKEWSYNEEK